MEEISIKESFKLFSNITEIIQEKAANWNKTGLVNIFANIQPHLFILQKMKRFCMQTLDF